MPQKGTLTIKEKKFIKEYIKDGNGRRAAQKVFNTSSEASARNAACQTLQRPRVMTALQQALEKEGITVEYIAKGIKESLEAENTQFFSNFGKVTDCKKVPAHEIRLKARDMLLKINGDYAADKLEVNGEVTFNYFKGLQDKYKKK